MTLTEFLLARIAEDEDTAQQSWFPGRAPAECEAKRRIVEESRPRHFVDHNDCFYSCPAARLGVDTSDPDAVLEDPGDCTCGKPDASLIQRILAAVYSDHPDYDTAWTP